MITATLRKSSDRYETWLKVFGTYQLPVTTLEPIRNEGPDGPKDFYRVVVSALTPEQRENVVQYLMERWKAPRADVEEALNDPNHGLPILAADIIVSVDHRAFR